MEFIETYNLTGLLLGICTFIIIGLFHPIVIKSEYYFGVSCWWVFMLCGIGGIIAAFLIKNVFLSYLTSIFAFSSLWGIVELFSQRKRVLKGWFPMNPKRKDDYDKMR